MLDELSQNSKLAGGAIYRADGTLVGSFGEAPVNRLGALSAGGEYLVDSNRYEVVWRRDQSGLDVIVVGRLNASEIPAQLQYFVWRIAGLVLLISGFVCVVTMFILDRIVLGPMLTIRDKLVSAQHDPAHADRYAMSAQRNDEVGEVVEALNSLLVRVSKTHREDLAAMVAMADNSNEGIIAYDRIWQVVYANRACFKFCNASGMRQLGEDGLPRFALADTPGTILLAELIEDGEFSGEATLIGAGGAKVPCYVNAGQILDESGEVLRYFATMTDVTQLSNARKNLQRQNLELEASNRVKNQFVANMSHELRTPLNAILGFSEMMMNEVFGPVGTEQYREYLRDINDSGNHLLEIINNILDLSKIEAGQFELRDEEVDAVHAIESSIRLIRERARHRNIEIGTDLPDRLPKMRGDSQKVKQILINLLGNAVKFTPEGGRITVSARTEPDGHLSIAVADNGVGIAEKDKAKVLLPFGQAGGRAQPSRNCQENREILRFCGPLFSVGVTNGVTIGLAGVARACVWRGNSVFGLPLGSEEVQPVVLSFAVPRARARAYWSRIHDLVVVSDGVGLCLRNVEAAENRAYLVKRAAPVSPIGQHRSGPAHW
ncbi:MAG: ATP-binding protein [Gammaproteobacteria bacterium]|nr:ATP-binding protein [Gammaproteobacteria bacterium]